MQRSIIIFSGTIADCDTEKKKDTCSCGLICPIKKYDIISIRSNVVEILEISKKKNAKSLDQR